MARKGVVTMVNHVDTDTSTLSGPRGVTSAVRSSARHAPAAARHARSLSSYATRRHLFVREKRDCIAQPKGLQSFMYSKTIPFGPDLSHTAVWILWSYAPSLVIRQTDMDDERIMRPCID